MNSSPQFGYRTIRDIKNVDIMAPKAQGSPKGITNWAQLITTVLEDGLRTY